VDDIIRRMEKKE